MIRSPCVSRCALNPEKICVGCGRTIAEIANWSGYAKDKKLEVIDIAAARKCQGIAQSDVTSAITRQAWQDASL